MDLCRRVPVALLFVFLTSPTTLASCTHDYGELTDGASDVGPDVRPGDAGDAGDTGDGGDSGTIDASGDSSPPDVGGDVGLDGRIDGGACGALGQRCCAATPCNTGACLAEVCVAFAGAYQVDESGGCEVSNPLFDERCACPPGFVDQVLMPMDARNTGRGELETLRICHAPSDAEGADFRGAYGLQSNVPAGCGERRCVENPATASCECPAGTERGGAFGIHDGSADDGCWRSNNLCVDAVAPALTFGGAYQTFDTGIGARCDEAPIKDCENPATGDCACPADFQSLDFPFMKLDLSQIADDILGACPATLHVCWRRPLPPG